MISDSSACGEMEFDSPGCVHFCKWVRMDSKSGSEKLLRQLSKIRRKKISKLKNKITSGKYKVDNLSLAKALFLSR